MSSTAPSVQKPHAIRSRSLRVVTPPPATAAPGGLLESLLREQRTLTAVEQFSRRHASGSEPHQARHYRDLIPAARPDVGQQYAFDVELDLCTGCKACVSACHSLNGLDTDETWRTVGALHGGSVAKPAQQTITTSCHHCVEPACLAGCPVKAYEKDPVTGIVKHLDDQCIGCQYCSLMCPYDAPKYSASRGIVRKCDMCSDRLAAGEAPACVQACPNGAIRISIVEQADAVQRSEAGSFLPGAPAPDHTIPATLYKSKKGLPPNMLPADFYTAHAEHSHPPLVVMLTLTQLAAGAFAAGALVDAVAGRMTGAAAAQASWALGLCFVALFASVFHLGRPQHAWKAFLGLRTSWLSREILAFAAFAKFGMLYAMCVVPSVWPKVPGKASLLALTPVLRGAAAVAGLAGVFCSVMVYAATKRPHWSGSITGTKFFATTTLLGAASVAALALPTGGAATSVRPLWFVVVGVVALKLLFEASVLLHRRTRQHTVLRRMAMLMTGDLAGVTSLRFVLGFIGGVILPVVVLMAPGGPASHLSVPMVAGGLALLCLVVGELLERYLFFRAAPGSRMPGNLA